MSTPDEWRNDHIQESDAIARPPSSSKKSLPPKPRPAFMDCSPSSRGGGKVKCSDAHSSAGKFSFGMGPKQAGRNSPSLVLKHSSHHSGGGSGTPSLFLSAAHNRHHHHHHSGGGSPREELSDSGLRRKPAGLHDDDDGVDDALAKDSSEGREHQGPSDHLDLDLLHLDSPSAVDAAILALTVPQRQQVQRLLCNPIILSACSEALDALSSCPNLSFLMLSLDGFGTAVSPEATTTATDFWPGIMKLMSALKYVVCLDMSKCLMQDRHLQVRGSLFTNFEIDFMESEPRLPCLHINPTYNADSSGHKI